MKTFTPSTALLEARNNPEDLVILDKWADALETTKLKQATDAMANCDNSACCLQVLELTMGNAPIEEVHTIDCSYPTELYDSATQLSGVCAEDLRPVQGRSFMDLNDDDNLTFKQIAQLIRGNEVTIND